MSRPKMVTVVFLRDTYLPRFTMKAGAKWHKRADRMTNKGFPLGGGFVEKDRYKIVTERKQ